jgi:3-hydroxybutyryl-CoA dehydrogenase
VSEDGAVDVWVVGAGTMGNQIAQACATSGLRVACFDASEAVLERAPLGLRATLDEHFVRKGKLSAEEAGEIVARIDYRSLNEDAGEAPSVAIEAVFEDTAAKKAAFGWIESRVGPATVVATNTSGLSVTEVASALQHRRRAAGFHFFNPVARMQLVEIVQTEWTAPDTVATLEELARKLGKTPVVCRDVTAFVANRCYEALLREAFWLAFEDVAAPWDVDLAMRLGYNFPIGPLELQDRIGTWNLLRSPDVQKRLLSSLSDSGKARVADLIEKGYLGRQADGTNRGIYEYFEEVLGRERKHVDQA